MNKYFVGLRIIKGMICEFYDYKENGVHYNVVDWWTCPSCKTKENVSAYCKGCGKMGNVIANQHKNKQPKIKLGQMELF